ncbi:MAG: hypothetical protein ACO3IN_05430 [Steroidobacteraceae bacterium]
MLPLPWVERLFERLQLVYGKRFAAQWDGMDMQLIRADWAHELAGFAEKPEPLRWALDHLPAHPPNVVEFRALARMAPPPTVKALPEPKADPQRVAEAMAKVHVAQDLRSPAQKVIDGLLDRHQQHGRLSLAQRQMLASCRKVIPDDDARHEAIDRVCGLVAA